MSISRTIAKNTLFNFINTAASTAISFVVSILLARGLGVEEYGLYTFLMWFLSLAGLIINLGLGEMTRRFIAEAIGQGKPQTAIGIARLSLFIRLIATLILAAIIYFSSNALTGVFTEVNDGVYFLLVLLVFLPDSIDNIFGSIYNGYQNYEYGAYLVLGTSPLRLGGVIAMLALGYGVEEIILVSAGISFIAFLCNIFFVRRLIPLRALFTTRLEPGVRKEALKYSAALMGVQGVSYFVWSQAEVLFLGIYTSIEDIAYYNLAFKFPRMIITLIPYVFGRVLLPTVAEQFGKGDMDKVRAIYITSARYLMMLTFPIVAGGIILAQSLISVIYGPEYQPAVALMQVIFIPFSTIGLTHASTSIIFGINKPSFILKTGIPVILAGIGLYLWAIPRWGVMGAAIAGSIPRIAVFFIYNYYVYKKIGVHWPIGDTVRIILASGIMGGAVFGIQYFLGDAPGLYIGIPAGAIVFFIALIALRFMTRQEIGLLRKAERRIPPAVRGGYASVINLIEKLSRRS